MRWLCALAVIASPALAEGDYADGVSGIEAAELVSLALSEAGVSGAEPTVPVRPFPACDHAPTVSPKFDGWETAELRCDSPSWSRNIRTRASVAQVAPLRLEITNNDVPENLGPMVVALARTMGRGEMVTAGDVRLLPRTAQTPRDTFSEIEQVVGRRLRSSIGEDQFLLTRHLDPDWAVRVGTPIALQIQVGPINVIAPGEALQDGRIGDVIELRNLSSGKVVRGVVTGDNIVALRPNII